MSHYRFPKLPPRIQAALDESGLPWELKAKAKHTALLLAGRQVGVLPSKMKESFGAERNMLQTVSTIRRIARQIKEGTI